MKKYIYVSLLILSSYGVAQNNSGYSYEIEEYANKPRYIRIMKEPEQSITERMDQISTSPYRRPYYSNEYGDVDRTDYYTNYRK